MGNPTKRLFSWSFMKRHYSLIPLFAMTDCMRICKLARDAIYSPDVIWSKQNPEPWNYLVKDGVMVRYKLFQGPADHRIAQTKYGGPAFPDNRPPIEALWKDYQKRVDRRED